MPDHAESVTEAAQTLAQIRELTARADRLLVRLRDGGMSWGDLAILIDPDNPVRSSAQRRVESARRRIEMESGLALLRDLRQAARAVAALLDQAVECVASGQPIELLNSARYRTAADQADEVSDRAAHPGGPGDLLADLRYVTTRGASLLRSTAEAAVMGRGIDLDLYRSTALSLTRTAQRGEESSDPNKIFA